MRIVSGLIAAAAVATALAFPGKLAAQAKSTAPDTMKLETSRGTVTFLHGKHSKATDCKTCHHESKAEKPATAEQQKCRDCHTSGAEAVAPMKTTLRMAVHNTSEKTGVCFDCHTKEAANGKTTPSKCPECHVKAEGSN